MSVYYCSMGVFVVVSGVLYWKPSWGYKILERGAYFMHKLGDILFAQPHHYEQEQEQKQNEFVDWGTMEHDTVGIAFNGKLYRQCRKYDPSGQPPVYQQGDTIRNVVLSRDNTLLVSDMPWTIDADVSPDGEIAFAYYYDKDNIEQDITEWVQSHAGPYYDFYQGTSYQHPEKMHMGNGDYVYTSNIHIVLVNGQQYTLDKWIDYLNLDTGGHPVVDLDHAVPNAESSTQTGIVGDSGAGEIEDSKHGSSRDTDHDYFA